MSKFDLDRRTPVGEWVLGLAAAPIVTVSLGGWGVPGVLAIGGGVAAGYAVIEVLEWDRRRHPGGGG